MIDRTSSTVQFLPVAASDEQPHEPSTNPAWKEANFAAVVDKDLSFYYEVGETPSRGSADAFCGIVLADGSLVFIKRRDEIPAERLDAGSSVDGFVVSCEEPLQHWTVAYDGDARRYAHPGDLLAGQGGYVPCRVAVRLDLQALAEPVLLVGGMTPGIYEQSVLVTGDVVVDGETYPVATAAYRNHTWGARTWTAEKRWLAAHATGDDAGWAMSFVLSEIAGEQKSYGWLSTDVHGHEDVIIARELPESRRREGAPFGDAYELLVGPGARRVVARFDRARHIPLRHREGGQVAMIDEDLGGWRVEDDGRQLRGSGLLEVLYVTDGVS